MVIVRELNGDVYFGEKGMRTTADGPREGYDMMSLRRGRGGAHRPRRLRDRAKRASGKLCSVDKANVLETSQLWRDVVIEIAADYPDVELTHMYVDNAAMQLVRNPGQFDVIVTGNLFGDILSDQASMCAGSIGMLPSASLDGAGKGLYEPIHGIAPDIAGQGKANPCATILSAAMLLRHSLGMDEAARPDRGGGRRGAGRRRAHRAISAARCRPRADGRRGAGGACVRPDLLELAVVIPTFNERRNVPVLVAKLDTALAGRNWEAIFVDDDSPDGTADAARELARVDARVRVIQRIGRRGLSSASIEGMCATAAPFVAVIDGDCSMTRRCCRRCSTRCEADAALDVVIGSRFVEGGGTGEWDQRSRRQIGAGDQAVAPRAEGRSERSDERLLHDPHATSCASWCRICRRSASRSCSIS